ARRRRRRSSGAWPATRRPADDRVTMCVSASAIGRNRAPESWPDAHSYSGRMPRILIRRRSVFAPDSQWWDVGVSWLPRQRPPTLIDDTRRRDNDTWRLVDRAPTSQGASEQV